MAKPLIRKPQEQEPPDAAVPDVPMLDDVAIFVGTEIENTLTSVRYRVECIATWLADEGVEEGDCILVLRKQLGFEVALYAIAYTELHDGNWKNLGL